MKTLILIVATIFASASALAQNNTINGDCSNIIVNNSGNIHISCPNNRNIESQINNLPAIIKFKEGYRTITSMQESIKKIKIDSAGDKTKLTTALIQSDRKLNDAILEWSKNKEELSQELSKQDDLRQKIYNKMEDAISTTEVNISILSDEVRTMKTDLSKVMSLFTRGELEDTLGFYGLRAGAMHLSKSNGAYVSFEYEWISPKFIPIDKRASMFISLSHLGIKNNTHYETLPGASVVSIDNDSSILLLGGGIRIFNNSNDWGAVYYGMEAGVNPSGKNGIISAFLGYEHFRRTARLGIEASLSKISGIKSEQLQFNSFGNSNISTTKESPTTFGVALKYSFR